MSDASVEASHDREVFDSPLVPFKCLDSREICNDHESARNALFVIVQDVGRQDHMESPSDGMIDRDLHFAWMPASAQSENKSPANLRRQHMHEGASILITHAEKLRCGRIETSDPPPNIDRYHSGVKGFQKAIRILQHLDALSI